MDKQKCAVIAHRRGGIQFHPRFLDLVVPRPCRPPLAQTKGKDPPEIHKRIFAIDGVSSSSALPRSRRTPAIE